ncbi:MULTISPECIES: DNA helicase II [Shewanella]|jgi:DNA helicase-2/ATP-dependent DNA helicase PcrA|uniref:DNA 3'-5' helicase n=1 Tax=Shewanella chilikensis TaxID=558541 RepID=A0ABX5PIF7_9GAMM|nr:MULTISPECIES: DNA helicase II [Shewanella]MBZ4678263.1 helicase [Shewanella sp.]MCA0949910.1 DNA helicase II [Shewanella chilikensis]MCL1154073.1 DNA helicase II [Shewanella chilikensis]MCL1163177.1 DNA helicase II [Shewanella chilikensis]PYE54700.1 ATP-dependent DNA helicase UvrD [Shewanella chilikensis]
MDVSSLLDGLNDKQREAVAAPQSSMLVLAGAGSGKTRVLTHRIAWLLQVENQSPYSIMAVTFTNKAAAEMRERVEKIVGNHMGRMWIGTFHGLAHRLLRTHWQDAGLPQNFQILDSDDQLRLLKRILKSLNLDEKQYPPRMVASYINGKKDEGLRPKHLDGGIFPMEQKLIQIYQVYQESCDRAGLVDFAEILLRAHELFLNKEHILAHYQDRFRNILVDEFQDTNAIQYAWIRVLAGKSANVMIVGDDDQSIYGWRGAQVENLHKFLQDFPNAETIRLEQNYRSSGNILKASNELIANNPDRLGKQLWTEDVDGEPISVYCAFNEMDEARFIIGRIGDWQDKGGSLSDCAILYRSNAQSRVLEEALLHKGLAYRIYGGLRFFERQEIKDAMGYLRLIANRDDDAAFERVVNTPARGIGDRTLDILRTTARQQQLTLWQACVRLLEEKVLAGRAANAVRSFMDLIVQLRNDTEELPLYRQADIVIQNSGLKAMYEQEKGEKAQARVENLEELVTAARTFEVPEELVDMGELNAFLSHAALEAGEGQADAHTDAVQLMTLHSAKGLEFPLVFMAGVEEGLFPSQLSLEEGDRLEEERRLCYVGMTRAMQQLYITYAESRRIYGRENYSRPSRFIKEIPPQYLQEIRLKAQVATPMANNRFSKSQSSFNDTGFNVGQRVLHPKFGEGIVTNFEGQGAQARVQVNFDDFGSKWLVVAYAKLTAC